MQENSALSAAHHQTCVSWNRGIEGAGLQDAEGDVCSGASLRDGCASSIVALAIQALPLDVGTVLPTTLLKHSSQRTGFP